MRPVAHRRTDGLFSAWACRWAECPPKEYIAPRGVFLPPRAIVASISEQAMDFALRTGTHPPQMRAGLTMCGQVVRANRIDEHAGRI